MKHVDSNVRYARVHPEGVVYPHCFQSNETTTKNEARQPEASINLGLDKDLLVLEGAVLVHRQSLAQGILEPTFALTGQM